MKKHVFIMDETDCTEPNGGAEFLKEQENETPPSLFFNSKFKVHNSKL